MSKVNYITIRNKEYSASINPIIAYTDCILPTVLLRLSRTLRSYQDFDAQSRNDLCDSRFSNDVFDETFSLSEKSQTLIFSMKDGLLTKLAVGLGNFVSDEGPFEGFIPTLSSSCARLLDRTSLGAFGSTSTPASWITSTVSNAMVLTAEAMNVVTRRIIKYITRIIRQKN